MIKIVYFILFVVFVIELILLEICIKKISNLESLKEKNIYEIKNVYCTMNHKKVKFYNSIMEEKNIVCNYINK
jgi:hypothetical protein